MLMGDQTITYGDLRLYPKVGIATVKDRDAKLSGQEYQLLAILVGAQGKTVTREALKNEILPHITYQPYRHLNTLIADLRQKLITAEGALDYIKTIHTHGLAVYKKPQSPLTMGKKSTRSMSGDHTQLHYQDDSLSLSIKGANFTVHAHGKPCAHITTRTLALTAYFILVESDGDPAIQFETLQTFLGQHKLRANIASKATAQTYAKPLRQALNRPDLKII